MVENFGDDLVLADSLDAVAACVTADCDSGGMVHNARQVVEALLQEETFETEAKQ